MLMWLLNFTVPRTSAETFCRVYARIRTCVETESEISSNRPWKGFGKVVSDFTTSKTDSLRCGLLKVLIILI